MLKIISLFVFLLFGLIAISQPVTPPFLSVNYHWCDSLMSKMTIEEKIGQLIMVTTIPSNGKKNEAQIASWINNQRVGGVLFLKTSPRVLARCAREYQKISSVPLFIAIDAENGLSFRMDSVVKYPHLMGLGSVSDEKLIYRMGREVGQQCKSLGINVNFAPVADVNSNQNNPVINYRSFGENPQNVASKTWQLAKGMQDENIIVSIKHFPGHGDTSFDSHLVMPVVYRTYAQLDSVEFLPFKTCIENGINGIMTAHIYNPQLDTANRPSTLSKRVMTEILRDSLGFNGLVFSDGMNMQGITSCFNEGSAAVEAIKAGVDVIEFVLNPDVVIAAIVKAIEVKEISDTLINAKCRKVLLAKSWAGLNTVRAMNPKFNVDSISKSDYQLTSRKLFEKSVTIIQNVDSILPLQRLDTLRLASVSIGKNEISSFQKSLEKYLAIDHFNIPMSATAEEVMRIVKKLKNYNLVIAGVHGTRLSNAANYSVHEVHRLAIEKLLLQNKTILVYFASPYSLNQYASLAAAKSILITYGENELSQDFAAQLIFGAIGTNSKLPVSISSAFPEGTGFVLNENGRLKYGVPEEVGINSTVLKTKIDSFANFGVREKIFPGCQVLVSKCGIVIFQESYGYYTYQQLTKVSNESIYDLASITKMIGPLPLIMKLVEDSVLKLDAPFSNYWPEFNNTEKRYFTLREVLAHQARLKPSVGIVYDVVKKKNQKKYFRERPTDEFQTRVAPNLYIRHDFKEKLYEAIKKSELLPTAKYEYTDLPFYLFPQLLTAHLQVDYETYLMEKFIKPIGASTLMYNPYMHFPVSFAVPTEMDNSFRKELIQGYVHDEGAAMLGGVSGNAGLFGSSNDLAKIMQFYLNKGFYGDLKFLHSSTVDKFNKVQFPENGNRRGLGFDKPYLNNSLKQLGNSYPAPAVSAESFGHSGFTGTFAWADPVNQLIFIFLSNRTCPTRDNKKITQLNFRPELQQIIYNCEGTYKLVGY